MKAILRAPLSFALGTKGDAHDEKAVKLALSKKDLNRNTKNRFGQTKLWVQCHRGKSRNLALLLADPQVDPNLTNAKGESPLWIAAGLGNERCVKLLLADSRVNPTLAPPKVPMCLESLSVGSPMTPPLVNATNHGRARCVELLLADPRIDPNLVDSHGCVQLDIAMCVLRCAELRCACCGMETATRV